ncbi:unnamed protein product [Protopolystoma xenopodis]|uniref:Large ribosomal subunit protein eL24 n=1 Tax=Protopolystoma xenopodis TaxID=117903 RepID=A0A3S5CDN8_9PLAT|nr:unnamed protein product [Protopolystoma xenopodis]
MKLEVCSYSGYKVYPGHGRRAVRGDGRGFYFISSKCERSHFLKRNPREVNWTVLYRRKYKKGQVEESVKRRNKRATRIVRDIAGASLADILAKRNQKPEVRKAMREQAIRASKEKQRAKETEKKQKKLDAKKKQSAPFKHKAAQKIVSKPAPRVSGKR